MLTHRLCGRSGALRQTQNNPSETARHSEVCMSFLSANAGSVRFALLIAAFLAWAVPCRALTVEEPLTVDCVRAHPAEWSVKVARADNGLVKFTFVRSFAEPRY